MRTTALRRSILIAALLAPSAAACAAPNPPSAAPAPHSSTAAASSTPTVPPPPPPPETVAAQHSSAAARIADRTVDGVDPCKVLPARTARSLGLPSSGARSNNEVLDNAPMCSYPADGSHLGLLITAVSTKGLDFFGPGKVAGDLTKTTVAGLPAYRNAPTDAPPGSNFCTITVGVRDGQALDVLFREAESETSVGRKVLCDNANAAARAAVAALPAR